MLWQWIKLDFDITHCCRAVSILHMFSQIWLTVLHRVLENASLLAMNMVFLCYLVKCSTKVVTEKRTLF